MEQEITKDVQEKLDKYSAIQSHLYEKRRVA